jgi:alginate O-acetyltransferase complex protein AlgI
VLFNAYDFLFGFLPIVLIGHVQALRRGPRAAMTWLAAASLFFYAHWYWPYLILFCGSMAFNFRLGQFLSNPEVDAGRRHRGLVAGIVANLGLLGFFKYGGFVAENLALVGVDIGLPSVALPLAISFFTFQQVAYLVDAHRGYTRAHDAIDYVLFVSFFPQLVAGPIVHHGEILPQLAAGKAPTAEDRSVGLTMFVMGLAKKVLIADALAPFVNTTFTFVADGRTPTLVGAWTGVLAYHFQLYFDFSGYSDMAIGLSRLFGIKLPANFDAPYRATDIGAFWRQWHMTLSRFLRDYVYIGLGGNRHGEARRNFNLFATMFLGGLWHGAGWTFVLWGGLHGIYLVIHQLWVRATGGLPDTRWGTALARTITWLAVLAGWPLFRSEDMGDALVILTSMCGLNGLGLQQINPFLTAVLLVLLVFTQVMPTSQRWMEAYEPVLDKRHFDEVPCPPWLSWQPTRRWAIVIALIALACVPVLERADAFLYWNF